MKIDYLTKQRILTVFPYLNSTQKRIYLAAEAISLGHGSVSAISKLTGVHRNTIATGLNEISSNDESVKEILSQKRIRREGGGRKSAIENHPEILIILEKILNETTFGDPCSPLKWTSKSQNHIKEALAREGYIISQPTVSKLLVNLGYSLHINQKMKQVGKESEDRDEQFNYINKKAKEFIESNNPVISIDCKKKENIGNFKNNGHEYSPINQPIEVLDHDFAIKENGKAAPYGIYDINRNEGYVNVGISSDTAMFAVNSIRNWWYEMGVQIYSDSELIYITADGGGSNGSRNRLWKTEIQKFVNETGIPVFISHFPPGTSKWNKIEHRMFSEISKNWRGRPLETLEIIVNCISSTTTKTGLKIKCAVDYNKYATGIKISDDEIDNIKIIRDEFRGDWNYTIFPQ